MQIVIVGLGYVGLPLAIEFGKRYPTLGYDISIDRINQLKSGFDKNEEFSEQQILEAVKLSFSNKGLKQGLLVLKEGIKRVFIVTVPTPVDKFKKPDLGLLLKASEDVGKVIEKGDVVIYESTVYPGCTEEECVPVLEKYSGLKFNQDFFCGYSPERINSGDKIHTLVNVVKITSGSSFETAEFVDKLYQSIIAAGTFKARSIRIAEAAKLVENCQRDVNISFVNELALIFDKIGIDTNDVLEAAGTKWNFVNYRPGLVGGHCIAIDPYYLIHVAQSAGYLPRVVFSGRYVNDQIGSFIANKVVKLMIKKDFNVKGARVLILGVAFKENCKDIRNSRVPDIYHELIQYDINVDIYDPLVDSEEVFSEYGFYSLNNLELSRIYSAIILAVAHKEFLEIDLDKLKIQGGVVFDTKAMLDREKVDSRL